MADSLDDTLTALETLTREMANAPDLTLEALAEMCERRSEFVRQVVSGLPAATEDARARVGAIVQLGALVECRLAGLRELLRRDLESCNRGERFAQELSRTVPARHPNVNVQI